jgi:mannose-6-phosphate isomerase-like protein (cupin superfamily)
MMQRDSVRAFLASGGSGIRAANGNVVEIKADAARTGGRLTVVEGTHRPATGPPLHVHDDVDEAFYLLEGEYSIEVGDEVFTATAGDLVFVPHGVAHRFESKEGGRMLLLYLPGGFDGYFEERERDEQRAGGRLSAEQLDAIGRRHGMRVVGEGAGSRGDPARSSTPESPE